MVSVIQRPHCLQRCQVPVFCFVECPAELSPVLFVKKAKATGYQAACFMCLQLAFLFPSS